MTILKKNTLFYLLRALLVLVIGISSYFLIITFYTNKQEALTFEAADRAMLYARDQIESLGEIKKEDGEVYAGETLLNNSTKIVNKVKEITGFGCTIFSKDVRISTTASAKDSDEIAIGTRSNAEIFKLVYVEGEIFRGITTTIGKEWLIIYEPLTDYTGERIGMLAVFHEHKNFLADLSDFKWIVAITIFMFLFFVQFLLWRAHRGKRKIELAQLEANKSYDLLIEQKSELEKLIFVVEEIEQAIAIIDKNDRIEWVNKSFEKSLQYTLEEAIGRRTSDIIGGPETDRTVIRKMDESIFINKKPIDSVVLQYRKDRSSYWARVYLTPLLNSDGDLEKYVAISLDITSEKKALDQLQESEANIRQIGETIPDVVYLNNISLRKFEYISPKCRAVLGANPDFFYSGQSHVDLFVYYEDRPKVVAARHKVESGTPYDIEYRVEIEGKLRWIRERSFPIFNDKGTVIKNSGICSDITESKKIQARLKRSHNNLKLLSKIGVDITEELSIVKIIENVHRRINEIMEAHGFAIGIINHEENELLFPKFIENNAVYINASHSLDEHILGTICIKENKEIIINDIEKEISRYTDKELHYTEGDDPLSLVYLPLKFQGEVIGVITVQSLTRDAYDDDQIELLRSLSVYISNALANAQLYESLEKKVETRTTQVIKQKEVIEQSHKDLQMLSQIGLDISSSVKFEEIFERLYENVNSLLDAEAFGVRIYDAEKHCVHYRYEIESGNRTEELTIPMTDKDNYTVWCIINRKELVINDNKKEYKNYVSKIQVPTGEMPDSLIFWPMIVDERMIGVITVQSFKKNAYTQRHQDIIKTLAFYTGIALSNAQLYATLESKVQQRTKEVSRQNREILDSINYARNIQYATLTSRDERLKLLPKSFVFYKPKDIVSGDFFRVDRIQSRDGRDLISFVVADCTGHGVPGASLAILCSSIIKQSLSDHNVYSPGEALEYAREQLNVFLKSSDSTIYDGMDLAFCVLNRENNMLYFSGAFSNCIIVRGDEEFILRGDRRHVGYQENVKAFTNLEFQLEPGDLIYLTTDGYIDQFGGPDDRKFTRKKFLKLIHEIKNEKITVQEELVRDRFNQWKGENEQTDDICVMGIRL